MEQVDFLAPPLPEGTETDEHGIHRTPVSSSEFNSFCESRRVLGWEVGKNNRGYIVEWSSHPKLTQLLSPTGTGVRQKHC